MIRINSNNRTSGSREIFLGSLQKEMLSMLVFAFTFAIAGNANAVSVRPADPGPYRVGHITENNLPLSLGRTTNITIWYPSNTLPSAVPTSYSTNANSFGGRAFNVESPMAAIKDAEIASGTFPVILYIHGGVDQSDNGRLLDMPLSEHLASHGFIIVGYNRGTEAGCVDFARDPSLIIDHLLSTSSVRGAIDSDKIGVNGFSFGGILARSAVAGIEPNGDYRDGRFKAMILEEPNPGCAINSNISIPYLVIDGSSFEGSGLNNQSPLFAETTLAVPRYHLRVNNLAHLSMGSGYCPVINGLREAALALNTNVEPLLNPQNGGPAFVAWLLWSVNDLFINGLSNPRDYCENVGVKSAVPGFNLDDGTGTTTSPPAFTALSGNTYPDPGLLKESKINELRKIYNLSFWKVHLSKDNRYEKFLQKGFAKKRSEVEFFNFIQDQGLGNN